MNIGFIEGTYQLGILRNKVIRNKYLNKWIQYKFEKMFKCLIGLKLFCILYCVYKNIIGTVK